MANKGKTKSDAIKESDTSTEKNAKAVTGLNITRAGNVFTAGWRNTTTYSKLKIKWRRKVNGSWKDWTNYANLPTTSDTSGYRTYSFGDYNPTTSDKLWNIEVCVATDQANETEKVYTQKTKDKKKLWYWHNHVTKYKSNTATAFFDVRKPSTPELTVADGAADTTFTLVAPNSNTDGADIATKVSWWTVAVANTNGAVNPQTYNSWGTEQHADSSTGKYDTDTRTFTNATGAADVNPNQSYTVMAKAVIRGPQGDTSPVYASIVYAWPLAATNVAGKVANGGTGYRITASWNKAEDATHPVKQYKVQYYIGTPANSSKAIPSGITWKDGTDFLDVKSGNAQSTTFDTDARIGADECCWIRVIQKNVQQLITPSTAVLVASYSTLATPTISSVAYDATSLTWNVAIDNNTSFSDAVTDISLRIGAKNEYSLGSVTGDGTLTKLLAVGTTPLTVVAKTKYGSVSSGEATQTFDPALSADHPQPYKPKGLTVQQIEKTGKVKLTWTAVMKGVTGTRITAAESATAWDVTPPTLVYDETQSNANEYATITGLTLDKTYYFKIQSINAKGTSNYSDGTPNVFLKSAEIPTPSITAVEDANTHDVGITWSWDTWPEGKQIQLSWSTNLNDANSNRSNPTTIDKIVKNGNQSFYVADLERGRTWYFWARFVSDTAISKAGQAQVALNVTPVAPTNVVVTDMQQGIEDDGKTTLRVTWNNTWKDTTKTELSWSKSPNAWNSTSGLNTHEIEGGETVAFIPDIELGSTWYVRVRAMYNDEFYAYSSIASIDLRTTPSKPVLTVSERTVSQRNKFDVSWTYSNRDMSEQSRAEVIIYNANDVIVQRPTVIGPDKAIMIDAATLAPNVKYHLRVQTTSANGKLSEASNIAYFEVVGIPTATISTTSLANVTLDEGQPNERTVKAVRSLPLTMTIGGAPASGSVLVYVERSRSIQFDAPDESVANGYEGELVAVAEGNSAGAITISQNDLYTNFVDGGWYRIVAYTLNELKDKSNPATLEFTVLWTHQALMPEATYVVDTDDYITKITPIAPTGTVSSDTFDIYRLSADRPELIVENGIWGTTYVDPYPALGENGGHRIVFKTVNGDYTTLEGRIAWLDCIPPFDETEQPFLESDTALIDFGKDRVDIVYNLDVSSSWEKDFTETKYLGGSVQGDWNPAVSRKTSLGAVMIKLVEAGEILKMRQLATHAGICHVRTPDGSSFPADVQVSEAWSSDKEFGFADFTLDITRVDSQTLDGMTLAEWEALHAVG